MGDASRNLAAAAGGARAGAKVKGESKARVSLEKAQLRPLGGWELAWGQGELGVGGSARCRDGFCPCPSKTGQAAALPPPVPSFWLPEFCLEGQPVPKGGRVPPGTSTGGDRTSWVYGMCSELSGGAQDGLMSRIAPPDAVGEEAQVIPIPRAARAFPVPGIRRRSACSAQ